MSIDPDDSTERFVLKTSVPHLFDDFPVGILVVASDREVLWANRAARQVEGRGASLLGRLLDTLSIQPEVESWPAYIRGLVSKEEGRGVQPITLTAGDTGPSGQLVYRCMPVPGSQSFDLERPSIWLALLAGAANDAGESHALDEIAVAEVAHELTNYVDGAGRFLRLAQRPDVSESQAEEFLADAVAVSKRMGRVLESWCNTNSGFPPVVTIGEPLREMLDHYFDRLTKSRRYPSIAFVRGYAALADVRVAVDCETIIDNLVRNACEAMDGAGRMTVRGTLAPGICTLVLEDDGPGVPETVARQMFDPFFTTKSRTGGTGVGLSLCHKLLTACGGTIQYIAGRTGGAGFHVTMPAIEVDMGTGGE